MPQKRAPRSRGAWQEAQARRPGSTTVTSLWNDDTVRRTGDETGRTNACGSDFTHGLFTVHVCFFKKPTSFIEPSELSMPMNNIHELDQFVNSKIKQFGLDQKDCKKME
jgi:hypothetical protein